MAHTFVFKTREDYRWLGVIGKVGSADRPLLVPLSDNPERFIVTPQNPICPIHQAAGPFSWCLRRHKINEYRKPATPRWRSHERVQGCGSLLSFSLENPLSNVVFDEHRFMKLRPTVWLASVSDASAYRRLVDAS